MDAAAPEVNGAEAAGPNDWNARLIEDVKKEINPTLRGQGENWRTVLLLGGVFVLVELGFSLGSLVSNPTISTLLFHLILVMITAAMAAMA